MRALIATLLLCLFGMSAAEAHSSRHHHNHAVHVAKASPDRGHDDWRADFFGSPSKMPSYVWPTEPREAWSGEPGQTYERPAEHGSLTRAKLGDGQVITVASSVASRFVGFFNALLAREGRLPRIACYSPTGHMRNSLHHWGGACDVGQTARNVAARMMYHVGDLAARFGLTDGCVWRHPDCGHVDVSGVGGPNRYAHHGRRHYAGA